MLRRRLRKVLDGDGCGGEVFEFEGGGSFGDWRKLQRTRAVVKITIEKILDRLPEMYAREICSRKCNMVYEHIYDSYVGAGKSIYDTA